MQLRSCSVKEFFIVTTSNFGSQNKIGVVDPSIQILYWQELGYPLPPKLAKYAEKEM
jgi:hypothetical protein